MDKAHLVQRLREFRALDDELERIQNLHGGIRRQDVWDREYYNKPYMTVISEQALYNRFQDIFVNMHQLNDNGKIGVVGPIDDTNPWYSKWEHLLVEIRSRRFDLDRYRAEALRPIHKYFEHKPPRGIQLFSGYQRPSQNYYVKIGKREHLGPMLEKGVIRLTPASFYSGSHLNDAIRDDELVKTFFLPALVPYLMGQYDIEMEHGTFRMKDAQWPIDITATSDFWMFCMSSKIENRLLDDFDGDAALIIRDINKFNDRIGEGLHKLRKSLMFKFSEVTYYDPYLDHTKVGPPEFLKHFRYSYQSEVRLVVQFNGRNVKTLDPVFIEIGNMGDYADLLML